MTTKDEFVTMLIDTLHESGLGEAEAEATGPYDVSVSLPSGDLFRLSISAMRGRDTSSTCVTSRMTTTRTRLPNPPPSPAAATDGDGPPVAESTTRARVAPGAARLV